MCKKTNCCVNITERQARFYPANTSTCSKSDMLSDINQKYSNLTFPI